MIFDGTAYANVRARELAREVAGRALPPTLGVCVVGENPVSKRYVALKRRIAEEIGVPVHVDTAPVSITTDELSEFIKDRVAVYDGYIVQLPLPSHVDSRAILDMIPLEKDVDMLSTASTRAYYDNASPILPPVIGVFEEILAHAGIDVDDKRVAVVGHGRLVGRPAEHWFTRHGATVSVVEKGDDLSTAVRDADIIVLGAGSPGILTPDMVKDGVIILDAGTSEDGGALKGDANPACAKKASLFTPVPGGVGPVTVIMLLKNLLILSGHDS